MSVWDTLSCLELSGSNASSMKIDVFCLLFGRFFGFRVGVNELAALDLPTVMTRFRCVL